jgi:hypothetical protein
LWHRRLGHLGSEALSKLVSTQAISCNKPKHEHICHACQLGRHVRLPFDSSSSRALHIFDLIHCDLCTSPLVSVSDYKYYLVIIDDFHITLGHFRYALNQTPLPPFLIFLPTCVHSLTLL